MGRLGPLWNHTATAEIHNIIYRMHNAFLHGFYFFGTLNATVVVAAMISWHCSIVFGHVVVMSGMPSRLVLFVEYTIHKSMQFRVIVIINYYNALRRIS